MVKKIGALIFLAMFMLTFVSAEGFFSTQPNSIYNIGDTLRFEVGTSGNGAQASIEMVCGSEKKMIYFNSNEDKTKIPFSIPLTKEFLRTLKGDCYFDLMYNTQKVQSMNFQISDSIETDVKFNALSFQPNSVLTFDGKATKLSNSNVNGFAELVLEGSSLSANAPITNGQFSGQINLPEKIAAGEYMLRVFVYEKEGEEITNNGVSNNTRITINQKPILLEIVSSSEIKPNEDLEFKAQIYDQTGQTIDGNQVAFRFISIEGEEVLNILSKTGDSNFYKIRKNAPVGYWNLTATSEGMTKEMKIYIRENKEAMIEMINNTVRITNVGNVPYEGFVEIVIKGSRIVNATDLDEETEEEYEEFKEIKYMNLSLGAIVEFQLTAPDGEYKVVVDDGSQRIENSALLTGRAIGINDPNASLSFINKSFFAWFFLIFILGLFIFVSSRRVVLRKTVLSSDQFNEKRDNYKGGVVKLVPKRLEVEKENAKKQPQKINPQKKLFNKKEDEEDKGVSDASHSLVIDGEKQEAAIISLKIKNNDELRANKTNAQDVLADVVREISDNHGKVYKSDGFIIGIFAPVVTRTFNNQLTALKVADAISTNLTKYNSKFAQKIKYGVAVSSGDIVAKKDKSNKLLFTPLGTSLAVAKKISEIAENKVLLSEDANRKVIPKAKTIANPEKFGVKTYSVKEIVDREQNQKFISQFLNRNEEYKKLDDFRLRK